MHRALLRSLEHPPNGSDYNTRLI